MKILITGDLVISQAYSSSNISDEVKDLFAKSDYNIVNLEAPMTESTSKIRKTGPHLKGDKNGTLDVLKALNIDLCTLANNHVLDYDEQGVLDTIEFCKNNNLKSTGAGANREEASKIFYINTEIGKIAIVNIAENEWSSATESSAGANGMDLIDDSRSIQIAKNSADYVFVIVHGGHEYYNLPSPRMQKQYRFYADQGADLVVGHHTHCINGYENYNNVPIYYSLGNFLFTKTSSKEDWYKGLLLSVEIKDGKVKPKLFFTGQEKESFKLSILKGEEENTILKRINAYNEIINNKSKLLGEWQQYVNSKSRSYINCWGPFTYLDYGYLPAIFNKLRLKVSNRKGASLFLNLMRCEAHYDISKEVLEKYLKK